MGDFVGDAAEQEPAGAGHALVADHDQVGLGLFGDAEDRLGGVALDRVGLHLDAVFARIGGGGVEDQVDVLARADLVLDVGWGLQLLARDLGLAKTQQGAGLIDAAAATAPRGPVAAPPTASR